YSKALHDHLHRRDLGDEETALKKVVIASLRLRDSDRRTIPAALTRLCTPLSRARATVSMHAECSSFCAEFPRCIHRAAHRARAAGPACRLGGLMRESVELDARRMTVGIGEAIPI